MKYKLKPGVESFEVVDGEFAGKKFFRGKVYEKIPQEEAKKFEKTRDQKSEVRSQRSEIRNQKSKSKVREPINLNVESGTTT